MVRRDGYRTICWRTNSGWDFCNTSKPKIPVITSRAVMKSIFLEGEAQSIIGRDVPCLGTLRSQEGKCQIDIKVWKSGVDPPTTMSGTRDVDFEASNSLSLS